MADGSESHGLWFERVYAHLRLPFWAGALMFGVGIPVAIVLVGYPLGEPWAADGLSGMSGFVVAVSLYMAMGLFTQLAARIARRRVERIKEETKELRMGARLDIGRLYSPWMALLVFVGIEAIIRPLYVFYGVPEALSLPQRVLVGLPFVYIEAFAFTFLWVLAYSFFTIYKVGHMDLALRPFTEDRSLGLSPLGRLSLTLTALYILFVLFNLVPNLLTITLSAPILAFLAVLTLLSFAFFLLPLIPFRKKLLGTRRALHDRLCPRLTRLYGEIEMQEQISQGLVNELTALRAMQEDIHQIHKWPFETAVVVRLSVIVFSVTAITLSRMIAIILGI